MDCSLENDEGNFLIQQSSAQHSGHQSKTSNNNLDKPFGMDLSVEFGGHSNRSSVVSQVSGFGSQVNDPTKLCLLLLGH